MYSINDVVFDKLRLTVCFFAKKLLIVLKKKD
jgi:hypothetical protein